MCRQFVTQYDWCYCEEDAGYQACSANKQSNGCAGITYETAHMQCFCNVHATKKFITEKKHQKKKSRSSLSSTSSGSSRNSRYSDISLEKGDQGLPDQQGPALGRRWYRLWGRSF